MQRFNKLIHLFLINICITVVASFGTNLQENGIAEVVQKVENSVVHVTARVNVAVWW